MTENKPFSQVRSGLYEEVYHAELELFGIDLSDWRKHPYSKLKSYFYLEVGAILTFFLLKTRVTPNAITLVYAFLGVLGAVLLATGYVPAIVAGIFVFFSKAIPDWIDGHIARIKGMTSDIGALLDSWGAHVNIISFQIGICLYVTTRTDSDTYLYLAIIILFTYAINFRSHVYQYIAMPMKPLDAGGQLDRFGNTADSLSLTALCKKIANLLRYNGRSRYTDFVLLVLLLEIYFDQILISIYLVWLWTVINALYCAYSLNHSIRNQNDLFQ